LKTSFVNKNGTFPREESSKISEYMHRTKGKFIRIDFTAVKSTRTLLQNAYWWGVIVKEIGEELGYTPEETHEILKRLFLPTKSYSMPSGGEDIKLTKSTTDLNTVEFEELCLNARIWAKDFLSMSIALPNQTNYNYYEVT
jgi:hypothetical protein